MGISAVEAVEKIIKMRLKKQRERNGKRRVSMVPQKQIKEWIPDAVEAFQAVMPSILVSYPEIRIASPTTLKNVRAELVEKTGALNRNMKEPYTSIMETFHGEVGDAILIYQKYCPDTQEEFNRALWHELGQFYAMSTEDESFYHLVGQELNEDRVRQTGYTVWFEFVAQCIANLITQKTLGRDWLEEYKLPEHWYAAKSRLDDLIDSAYNTYPNSFNEYDLALYFADILTDPEACVLMNGAANNELMTWDLAKQEYMPLDMEMDPTSISHLPEEYHSLLFDAMGLLQKKIREKEFWKVKAEFLNELGTIIMNLNYKKTIAYAQKMFRNMDQKSLIDDVYSSVTKRPFRS